MDTQFMYIHVDVVAPERFPHCPEELSFSTQNFSINNRSDCACHRPFRGPSRNCSQVLLARPVPSSKEDPNNRSSGTNLYLDDIHVPRHRGKRLKKKQNLNAVADDAANRWVLPFSVQTIYGHSSHQQNRNHDFCKRGLASVMVIQLVFNIAPIPVLSKIPQAQIYSTSINAREPEFKDADSE